MLVVEHLGVLAVPGSVICDLQRLRPFRRPRDLVVSCPRVMSDGAARASLLSVRGHLMLWRVDGVPSPVRLSSDNVSPADIISEIKGGIYLLPKHDKPGRKHS